MGFKMKKLSSLLENCNSAGLKLQNYESDYLQSLFELNLQGNYNLLLENKFCLLLLKEFFNNSIIRYCDTENNSFLLEKISKEFSRLVKEEVGRNYHTVDNDGISPEEISADKGAYFKNGIDPHSEDECTVIKVKNKTVLKTFDSPEAAQLYSRNASRMYNVKN